MARIETCAWNQNLTHNDSVLIRIKGAFTRQSKNGTDPTKTGTVPIVFAKKQ